MIEDAVARLREIQKNQTKVVSCTNPEATVILTKQKAPAQDWLGPMGVCELNDYRF